MHKGLFDFDFKRTEMMNLMTLSNRINLNTAIGFLILSLS